MDWFKELYDDFRMRTGFGSIPDAVTAEQVDFLVAELCLYDGAKVLDLFCGTGRHCVELAKRGFRAVGIEYNGDYLAIAAEKARSAGVSPTFIQGDVRDTDFGSGYDACIIMWASFGYFVDAEDRRVLEKIHAALRPGGRFLIQIKNRDYLLKRFKDSGEETVAGVLVREDREFDMLSSRVNVTITRGEPDGPVTRRASWRMYSAHEMKNILEDIGFVYVAGYSGPSRKPLTLDTHLMNMIFEKRKCQQPGGGDA